MTQTFFNHFNCRRLSPLKSVVQTDYSVYCVANFWTLAGGSTLWWILAAVSALGLAFISFGVPIFMFLRMRRSMAKYMRDVKHGKTKRIIAYRDFNSKYGFAAGDYKPEAYYAEPVDLIRKLILSGFMGLIFPGSVLQSFLSVIFSIVFLLLHIKMWPYQSLAPNVLKLISDFQIVLCTLVSLVLKIDAETLAEDNVDREFYGFVLYGLLLLTIVFMIYTLMHEAKSEKALYVLQRAATDTHVVDPHGGQVLRRWPQSSVTALASRLRSWTRAIIMAARMQNTSVSEPEVNADATETGQIVRTAPVSPAERIRTCMAKLQAQIRSIAAAASALHACEMQLQALQTESEEHDAAFAVESTHLEKLLGLDHAEAAESEHDGASSTTEIMNSVHDDVEQTHHSMGLAGLASHHKLIRKIANFGGKVASLFSPRTETCLLHVRNIGSGGCKSEELLKQVFGRYGEVLSATIRDRVDNTGQDTSWALVQMANATGAAKARTAAFNDEDGVGAGFVAALDNLTRLRVQPFNKRVATSIGGMQAVANTHLLSGKLSIIKYVALVSLYDRLTCVTFRRA